MNDVIAAAIRDRKILAILAGSNARMVEPHAYGLDQDGRAQLLCYDVSDAAAEGRRGWNVLALKSHMVISPTAERFGRPRTGYRRDDTGLCAVLEQV